jgi:hypothetical protein
MRVFGVEGGWNRKISLSSCEVHGRAEVETTTVAKEMAEC